MRKMVTKIMKQGMMVAVFACMLAMASFITAPITAQAATEVPASDNSSSTVDLNLDTEYIIPQVKFFNYYSFAIKEASRVQVTASGTDEYEYAVTKNTSLRDDEKTESTNGVASSTQILPAGEYYLIVKNRNCPVNLTIKATPYQWGTVKLESFNNCVFTVSYTPGAEPEDSETYISSWYAPGYADAVDGKNQKYTGTMDKSTNEPGHVKLTIAVRNDKLDIGKEFEVVGVQKPEAPKISEYFLEDVNTNSAIIGGANQFSSPIDRTKNGNYYKVELKKNGVWTDCGVYSASQKAKLTSLTPNTKYEMRLVGILREQGYEDIMSSPSNVVSFTTGCKNKPSIKSIKVTNVKVKKIPKVWHPGQYVGTVWRAGYYTGGYKETSFKVTVTLKSRVKGPAGLDIDGVFVKGSGKTFKTKGVIRGNKKGKKVNFKICYANHESYGGKSPATSKKVKLK